MNTINDGGSAFPETHDEFDSERGANGEYRIASSGGMTLRDYFAAKAMAAIINEHTDGYAQTAAYAYSMADAMLKARSA